MNLNQSLKERQVRDSECLVYETKRQPVRLPFRVAGGGLRPLTPAAARLPRWGTGERIPRTADAVPFRSSLRSSKQCSLPRGSRPTDIALRAPSRSLGHQQRFFQDRSPIKCHSMRSVWRPVRVFTPNGLLSGGGRHTDCVGRTICGHLLERSNCVFSDIAYLYTENS